MRMALVNAGVCVPPLPPAPAAAARVPPAVLTVPPRCGCLAGWNGGDGAAVVYFCMVRNMSPPSKKSTTTVEEGHGSELDSSYYASDHVVCFVTEPSKQSDELE